MPSQKKELRSTRVIDLMAVPNHDFVYYIGARARHVSFWAQQNRALNLAWALSKEGLLGPGKRCAVIGGGLAGMTAAVGAFALEASVVLFERRHRLMHLQQENQQRYLHPRIIEWPARGSVQRSSEHPCLQWSAGLATDVVDVLLDQWKRLEPNKNDRLEVRTNHDLVSISFFEGKPFLRYRNAEGNIAEERFDVVIVAVGFGLERNAPSISRQSYWDNDNLTRAVLRPPIPRTYLISGAGDGGLIDAVRLRLDGFRHDTLSWDIAGITTRELVDHQRSGINLERLRRQLLFEQKLLAIEEEAWKIKTEVQHPGEYQKEFRRRRKLHSVGIEDHRIIENMQSDYLLHSYEMLSRSEGTAELLREHAGKFESQLRQDTKVTLNHTLSTPLTLSASIINRVIAFLFIKYGQVKTISGRASFSRNPSTEDEIMVRVHNEFFGNIQDEIFNEVIIRHGPESPLTAIFGASVAAYFEPNFCDLDSADYDATGEPQYDYDFGLRVRKCVGKSRPEDVEYSQIEHQQTNFEKELQPLVADLLKCFGPQAKSLRCALWKTSLKYSSRLVMVTRYLPLLDRSRRTWMLTYASSKGLIGRAFARKQFCLQVRDEKDSEIEYEISLITDFHFSTSEAAPMYKNKRALFAFPIMSEGKVVAVVFGDFSIGYFFQLETNRSKLLEILLAHHEHLSRVCAGEADHLPALNSLSEEPLNGSRLYSVAFAVPAIQATGNRVFCTIGEEIALASGWDSDPTTYYESGSLACFISSRQGSRGALIAASRRQTLGDVVLNKDNELIGTIVQIHRPISSHPRARIADDTIHRNRISASLIRLASNVRIKQSVESLKFGEPALLLDVFIITSTMSGPRISGIITQMNLTERLSENWFCNLFLVRFQKPIFPEMKSFVSPAVYSADGIVGMIIYQKSSYEVLCSPMSSVLNVFREF